MWNGKGEMKFFDLQNFLKQNKNIVLSLQFQIIGCCSIPASQIVPRNMND
jgi:hypothetical protein